MVPLFHEDGMANKGQETSISGAVLAAGALPPWPVPQLRRLDAASAENGIGIITDVNTGSSQRLRQDTRYPIPAPTKRPRAGPRRGRNSARPA